MTAAPPEPLLPTIYSSVADMAERYVRRLEVYDDPSYCQAVRSVLDRHLVRDYGQLPINDFTMAEASAIINRMRRAPYPNTVINIYCSQIRAAFESEYRNGRLYDNPWTHVHIPQRETRDKRVLSSQEVRLLEEAFAHNALGDFFGLMLHTGLKRCEAAGILIKSWDHETHQLHVNSHIDYSTCGGGRLMREAYNGLDRWIPLSPDAEDYLSQAVERQLARQGAPLRCPNPDGLAFANRTGRPLGAVQIRYEVGVIRQLTGIADFSPNLLRESFVVSRLRSGVPVHVLQSYLGFQQRETVLAYASLTSTGTREAALELESYFDEVSCGQGASLGQGAPQGTLGSEAQ